MGAKEYANKLNVGNKVSAPLNIHPRVQEPSQGHFWQHHPESVVDPMPKEDIITDRYCHQCESGGPQSRESVKSSGRIRGPASPAALTAGRGSEDAESQQEWLPCRVFPCGDGSLWWLPGVDELGFPSFCRSSLCCCLGDV